MEILHLFVLGTYFVPGAVLNVKNREMTNHSPCLD